MPVQEASLANLKRVPKGGPSPNPSGRPKMRSILAGIAAELTEADVKAIARAAIADAKRRGNASARKDLIDRTDGAVTQKIEYMVSENAEAIIDLAVGVIQARTEWLTEDQQQAMIDDLFAALKEHRCSESSDD